MEEDNNIPEKVSKYNSAAAQLQRLDRLWDKIHLAAPANQFLTWNAILDRVWCELCADIDPEKNSKDSLIEEKYLAMNKKIANLEFPLSNGQAKGFKQPFLENPSAPQIQKALLMEKEAFLRRLQNNLGKGTAWKDPYEDEFE